MTSTRFNFLGRAFAAGLLALALNAPAQPADSSAMAAMPRRPSIILIQCEGLGYGDLSCYGQTKFQTPNLDKLAADGIRFTNYHAGDVATVLARAALLTGMDIKHLRQSTDASAPLADGDVTVAQVLKNSGYHTGYIGEWSLGDEKTTGAPWRKGFDEFAGYLNPADAENYYADYIFRYAPKSLLNPTNNQPEDFIGREMIYVNTLEKKTQYIPDVYAHAAVSFVGNNEPDQFNHHRPFFLVVNYKIPGRNVTVPSDAPFSAEAWPQPQKNKAAIIARLDNYVGQLREQLEKSGLTNGTAIFFTSDTGPKPGAADPKFFQSAGPDNGLVVPMIACWPGNIPAGRTSGAKWAAKDFLPTAADIGLVKLSEKVDGVSALPALLDRAKR
jgi:arylsulfatase A-like enzyme